MNKNGSIQVSTDFLKLLEGKSSLFLYEDDPRVCESLADIIACLGRSFELPVICMHWGESPSNPEGDPQTCPIILPISRNFTSTLISLGKRLADGQHIIYMNNTRDITFTVDRKPFCRFLVILLDKCRKRHSTLLAAFRTYPDSAGYEADMNHLFDNIFRIDAQKMEKIIINGHTEKSYSLLGEELIAVHRAGTDMEKIREIFRLTPDEQKELDGIASRQIREFNIP